MKKRNVLQIGILFEMIAIVIIVVVKNGISFLHPEAAAVNGDGFIKWVDFKVSCEALERAYELDLESHDTDTPLNWIELLAYAGAKGGGEFTKGSIETIEEVAEKITKEESTMEELSAGMKYYPYYKEAYSAVLDGYLGSYEIEEKQEDGTVSYVKKYGLKAFSPLAKGFEYQDYDDFGVSRSYGFKREHLGHDMMGQIGTPVIAVESGVVEAIGWNQYGGWRIGIRSYDTKRYYYYAHLRQNYPYVKGLKEGSEVTAGDVIGYMGHTGYSTTENVNNIEITHLHFGVQLIFDESQKDGNGEIWIDVYPLVQFLHQNQSEVQKVEGSKEWKRIYQMREEKKNPQDVKNLEETKSTEHE